MNVLVVSTGADTGGQGIRIKRAFEGTDINVRSAAGKQTYIDYPNDIVLSTNAKSQELYDWADVVHHKNRLDFYEFDNGQNKPAIIHHQGTRLRNNYREVIKEDRSIGAVPVVSTIDLLKVYPQAQWLPSPYNKDFLMRYRRARPNRKTVRICHAPTNRRVKSTEVILQAVNKLSKSYDIEFDLIEGQKWLTTLSRKGRADIFIDQLVLGYGNNAVEAWGMGIPVIGGVSDPEVRELMIDHWGEIPFYEASEQNIQQKIEDMINDVALRSVYAQIGHNHFDVWHDEYMVMAQLSQLWKTAPNTLGRDRLYKAEIR